MAAFAKVELLETTFEAWPTREAAFRLVIAAQAWHWVSPELRFAKAAQILSPGGSLAVFANVPVGLPAALLEDFRQIYLLRTGAWGLPYRVTKPDHLPGINFCRVSVRHFWQLASNTGAPTPGRSLIETCSPHSAQTTKR